MILGKSAARIGLPKITGYLAAGLIFGPFVGNIVTAQMMTAGKAVEGIAVALIALTAGGELRVSWLKKQARRLLLITLSELFIVAAGIIVFVPSLRAYVTPDLMGGGKVTMLGNLLQQQFMTARDWPFGSAIGFIMMIVMLLAILLYFRVEGARE